MKRFFSFLERLFAGLSAIALLLGLMFVAGICLSLPWYGWIASFLAGIFTAGIRVIRWPIKIALLVIWGPMIMAFGYYIVFPMVGPVSIVQGAICWVIFITAFVMARCAAGIKDMPTD